MGDLSTGECVTLACLLEVAAPKPGNVHRAADFTDMTLQDFLVSAVALGQVLNQPGPALGQNLLEAMRATRRLTSANTNLGISLLLTPLAMVPRDADLRAGVQRCLTSLTPEDARDVYAAIRGVAPGGLQPADQGVIPADIAADPPADLLSAMQQAATWDLVARQYANGFTEVFDFVVPALLQSTERCLSDRIVRAHVQTMSRFPDSLIARKCGSAVAQEAAAYAGQVLAAGSIDDGAYHDALADLDFWLRADGNRRNPGTTADLLAAGLFVLLRDGLIGPPYN